MAKQRKPTKEKVFDITRVMVYKQSTGWFLAQTADGETVTGTSIIPPYGRIRVQAHFEAARGSWHIYEMVYSDADGITYALLKSNFIEGIADVKAESAYEVFGSKIWGILDAAVNGDDYEEVETGRFIDPKMLLQDIDGVGPIVAGDMITSWAQQREYFHIAMNAVRCDMATWQWREIAKDGVKADIFDMMVHNIMPYSIYDLVQFGLDWEHCDRLALAEWDDKPALSKEHPIRLAGMVKFLVNAEQKKFDSPYSGGSCIPIKDVNTLVKATYGVDDVYSKLPENLSDYGLIEFDEMLYPSKNFDMEMYIAKFVVRQLREGSAPLYTISPRNVQSYAPEGITLSDEQIQAIQVVLANRISILTGGPGVGKTTILRTLVDILKSKREKVYLAAFTGAASRRMQMATDHDAATLHRTFGLAAQEEERIEHGTIIIDESSMNSSKLTYQVFRNIGPKVRVILVGDPDQLPPVDWGEPFIQLIETNGVPVARLTQVFRQKEGSKIAEACRMVNEGLLPEGDNEELFILSGDSPLAISERFDKGWRYFKENFPELGRQCLTPLNKRELVGREALNVKVQAFENPMGEPIPGTPIRVNDRIVCLRNDYQKETRNGMTGIARGRTAAAEDLLYDIEKAKGDRKKIARLMDQYDLNDMLVAEFDDEYSYTDYALHELGDVTLSYAMTVHKAQGNQFDVVIVVLPRLPDAMRLRQIVYTAMSRAKKKLVVIEQNGELERCVRNERKLRRLSKMKEMFDIVLQEEHVDMLGWSNL